MNDVQLNRIAAMIAGKIKTAGKIEFVKDTGPLRRDVRAPGFQWSSDAMRNLAKVLWAVQRAHSYTMTAYRTFSKMNSSQFSPDGLLGGRGYIQAVKDMRRDVASAAEVLSAFADTIQDELDADHWKGIKAGVEEIVEDAEQIREDPERFVEGEFDQVRPEDESEYGPIVNPEADDYNPDYVSPEGDGDDGDGDGDEDDGDGDGDDENGQSQFASASLYEKMPQLLRDRPDYGRGQHNKKLRKQDKVDSAGSMLPTDNADQMQSKWSESEMIMHTTTPDHGSYSSITQEVLRRTAAMRLADSALPVDTLPGPRVDHIGPGEGNEAGHYNDDEVWPSDDPAGEGLGSGVNESKSLLEDWVMDGNTPYYDPTQGDESVLVVSSRIARENYSWLPGSRNEKNLDYYRLGLSDEDVNWMRDHSDPDPPEGPLNKETEKSFREHLWGVQI
jgi:hypothetical protein